VFLKREGHEFSLPFRLQTREPDEHDSRMEQALAKYELAEVRGSSSEIEKTFVHPNGAGQQLVDRCFRPRRFSLPSFFAWVDDVGPQCLGGKGDRGSNSWDCQPRVFGQDLLDGFSSRKLF
jgi:hypothetical protein